MALEQFRQDSDEAVRKTSQVLDLVAASQARIDEVHGSLVEYLPHHEERLSTVVQAFDDLTHGLEEVGESLEQGSTEDDDDLVEALDGLSTQLETAGHGVRDAAAVVRQSATSAHAGLDLLEHQMADHLQEVSTQSDQWSATLEQSHTELHDSLAHLTESLAEFVRDLDETQDAVDATCAELSTHLGETHAEAFEEHFGSMSDAVQEHLVDGLADDFKDVHSGIEEALSGFGGNVQELAGSLQERVGKLLEDLGDAVQEDFQDEIKEAVETLVEDAVKSMAAEAMEGVALTEAGVATTETLSPLLPELLIAREGLDMIAGH